MTRTASLTRRSVCAALAAITAVVLFAAIVDTRPRVMHWDPAPQGSTPTATAPTPEPRR